MISYVSVLNKIKHNQQIIVHIVLSIQLFYSNKTPTANSNHEKMNNKTINNM